MRPLAISDDPIRHALTPTLTQYDLMRWDALDEETRQLASLVLLGKMHDADVEGAVTSTILDAYKAGWRAGVDSCEVESHGDPTSEFDYWRKRKSP